MPAHQLSPTAQLVPVTTPMSAPCAEVWLSALYYVDGWLTVPVASRGWDAHIVFPQVYGFRLLDELDLDDCLQNALLRTSFFFEVQNGGWNALEQTRPSFHSGRLDWAREYLIATRNECVSVLSKAQPQVLFQSDAAP